MMDGVETGAKLQRGEYPVTTIKTEPLDEEDIVKVEFATQCDSHLNPDTYQAKEDCPSKIKLEPGTAVSDHLNGKALKHEEDPLLLQNGKERNESNCDVCTEVDKPKKSYCGVCKKWFETCVLQGHKCSDTHQGPFKCDICEASFSVQIHLKEHYYTHTGESPLACIVCSKTFLSSSSLKQHLFVHRGERPYYCADCEMSFKKRGDLNVHLRKHQRIIAERQLKGNNPYECKRCNLSFEYASTFRLHKRIRIHKRNRGPGRSEGSSRYSPSDVASKKETAMGSMKDFLFF